MDRCRKQAAADHGQPYRISRLDPLLEQVGGGLYPYQVLVVSGGEAAHNGEHEKGWGRTNWSALLFDRSIEGETGPGKHRTPRLPG